MIIAKSRVVAELHGRGQHDRADWVDRALPEQIDTAQNASLLGLLSLDLADLADKADAEPQ
jgi:hypothetical protein